jgi:hypothetical protein
MLSKSLAEQASKDHTGCISCPMRLMLRHHNIDKLAQIPRRRGVMSWLQGS